MYVINGLKWFKTNFKFSIVFQHPFMRVSKPNSKRTKVIISININFSISDCQQSRRRLSPERWLTVSFNIKAIA